MNTSAEHNILMELDWLAKAFQGHIKSAMEKPEHRPTQLKRARERAESLLAALDRIEV